MVITENISEQKQEHDSHAIADRGFVLRLIVIIEPLQELIPRETGHIVDSSHIVEELLQDAHVVVLHALVGIEPCIAAVGLNPCCQRFACRATGCTGGRGITFAF